MHWSADISNNWCPGSSAASDDTYLSSPGKILIDSQPEVPVAAVLRLFGNRLTCRLLVCDHIGAGFDPRLYNGALVNGLFDQGNRQLDRDMNENKVPTLGTGQSEKCKYLASDSTLSGSHCSSELPK